MDLTLIYSYFGHKHGDQTLIFGVFEPWNMDSTLSYPDELFDIYRVSTSENMSIIDEWWLIG